MNPALLLLDEPTSQLDSKGKQELCELLTGFKSQGYTIIMAEHDPRPFESIIDRYLPMSVGRVGVSTPTLPDPARYEAKTAGITQPAVVNAASAVIDAQEICLSYPETGVALQRVSLKVMGGERIHLFGSNGAGKSSLLRCLTGLETPDSGTVTLAGIANPGPQHLPGKVGVLFQNPSRQLFAESVHEEVAFTLRRMGVSRRDTERVVAEALRLCGIGHLAERTPLTLSFGEQHRVALAAVLAPGPELLLLDEPFAGLDFPQRLALLAILAEMPGRYGTTVVIASHDELPDQSWADRTLKLSGGQLDETSR
jgi:energy-coupling factor transport system ATP-binding protein